MYQSFTPHPLLRPYIDAYWIVTGERGGARQQRILPDGCVDIIFNAGDDAFDPTGSRTMEHGKIYLVGTMTTFEDTMVNAHAKFIGVRFKPGAFPLFFRAGSLHELTNETMEWKNSDAPDMNMVDHQGLQQLELFFLQKLPKQKPLLICLLEEMEAASGACRVATLADKYNTSARQLERMFRQQVGVPPKELASILRFRRAHAWIRNRSAGTSLLDIAIACGYYDQAHLANEIRRFSGRTPSHI